MQPETVGQLLEASAGVLVPIQESFVFDGTSGKGKLLTAAVLTTALTGSNNDLDITANTSGAAGNSITVHYIDPGVDSAPLLVRVNGNSIHVWLATGSLTAASGTITDGNATNFSAGDTVTIGSTVYRFESSLTQIGDIKIGASADASLLSLAKTINGTGTAGTDMFTDTPADPAVTSTSTVTSHAITVTAITKGTVGNSIALAISAHGSVSGANLTGGVNTDTITTTSGQIITALAAEASANALVTATNHSGNDGSGVVTAMSSTALSGGSDGLINIVTIPEDGLLAVVGDCAVTLTGTSATLEVGVTGNTAALIPTTTATTVVAKKRLDSTGLITNSTAPNAVPFFPVRAGDIIQMKVGTASITGGTLGFRVFFKSFLGSGGGSSSGALSQGTAAALSAGWPVLNGEAVDVTGTFTNATQTTSVTATGLDGYGNLLVSINGTYATASAVFEGSDDGGTTWYPCDASLTQGNAIQSGYTSLTNTNQTWQINVPGYDSFRVRSTAVATGTVNVRISPSAALGSDGATVTNLSSYYQPTPSTATWVAATALNTALAVPCLGAGTVTLTSVETGTTTTAGALTFEVFDGTNWWAVSGQQIGSYTIQSSYTLVNGTNVAWQFDVAGFQQFRVRLSTQITGTGTPQVVLIAQAMGAPNSLTPSVGWQHRLDQINDAVTNYPFGHSYTNITTGTTTTVKSGAGVIEAIVVNTLVASATITVYDNTAGSGTKIGTFTLPSTITGDDPVPIPYDGLAFTTGLTLVTSGATDITVVWR